MDRRLFDVIVPATVVAVALASGLVATNAVVRAVGTLPLVLILPGYALTAAIFPGRVQEAAERLLLALGLSIAVTVLCGLALNETPWGLQAGSWALALGGVTLGASAVVAWRRRHAIEPWRGIPRPNPRAWALYGVAGCLVVTAIAVSRTEAAQQPRPGFTQLWMLPAKTTGMSTVRIGIKSMEARTSGYDLRVRVAGRTIRTWAIRALKPGETWETTATLSSGRLGPLPVDAVLYRADTPRSIYRRVTLWLGR